MVVAIFLLSVVLLVAGAVAFVSGINLVPTDLGFTLYTASAVLAGAGAITLAIALATRALLRALDRLAAPHPLLAEPVAAPARAEAPAPAASDLGKIAVIGAAGAGAATILAATTTPADAARGPDPILLDEAPEPGPVPPAGLETAAHEAVDFAHAGMAKTPALLPEAPLIPLPEAPEPVRPLDWLTVGQPALFDEPEGNSGADKPGVADEAHGPEHEPESEPASTPDMSMGKAVAPDFPELTLELPLAPRAPYAAMPGEAEKDEAAKGEAEPGGVAAGIAPEASPAPAQSEPGPWDAADALAGDAAPVELPAGPRIGVTIGLLPDADLAAMQGPDEAPLAPLETLDIVGSYDSAGTRFTMYSDGSVTSVGPAGERRFRSLEELRLHFDAQQASS